MRHSRSALCMLMLIFWAGALQHSSFACEFEAYPLGPALTMTPQPITKFTEIYIQLKNDIITVSYTLDTPESDTYMLKWWVPLLQCHTGVNVRGNPTMH